jgi:hypothetical protein
MAPQRLEKIESALGNGRVSEASNPQDLVHGARLTQRSLGPIQPLAEGVDGLGRDPAPQGRRRRSEENYPPCKALKNHEMEK